MKVKPIFTRRQAIVTGLSSLGGLLLPGCSKPLPPTYGKILRMGDMLTYTSHRALLPGQSLAKEYGYRDITSFPAVGTTNPGNPEKSRRHNEEYAILHKSLFKDWRLSIEGAVARPGAFSIDEIHKLPSRTQTTRHTCEEGWTAIGQWTGVPLGHLLERVGILPHARYVNFYAYDGWKDSIDLMDAFHPQTLLAYGMNGRDLPVAHGAPLRLRVEKQIGYKSMKYLKRIVVTDEFTESLSPGWAWYTGI